MAIQYAGGTPVDTFVAPAAVATKTLLADWLKTQLAAAGWTFTGVSGAWVGTTAATTTGTVGLSAQIVLSDSALTNCVSIRMRAADGSGDITGIAIPLLPNQPYWISANKFQFFVRSAAMWQGSGAQKPPARTWAGGGCLYVPSYAGINTAIWGMGNAQNDTDTTARNCWGDRFYPDSTATYVNINGLAWAATNASGAGVPTLTMPWFAQGSASTTGKTAQGALYGGDAIVSMGISASGNGYYVGQLWDAVLLPTTLYTGQKLVFDNVVWSAITDNSRLASGFRGSLLTVSSYALA